MTQPTNLPEGLYIRDTPAESPSGPPAESLEPHDRYVKLQWEVGIDARLKHLDVRLLFILKGCQHNGEKPVDVGRRQLAKYANASQRAVADSISRLAKYGWVEVSGGRRGERAMYATKEVKFKLPTIKAVVDKVPDVPQIKRELVRCPLCSTLCRQILKVGWCRRCGSDKRVEKTAERVARRVVKEEIAQEKMA